jgi:hypothetical protein
MNYRVQNRIRVKTKTGEIDLEPGTIIKIEPEKACAFIQAGQITPLQSEGWSEASLKTGNNTITPTEKTQPRAIVKAIWPPEVQVLMDWFMKLETPTEPFYLEPHRRVIDPEKFFVSLQNEIAIGPSCPRNRTGALLCDLKILKKFLH